MALKVLCGEPRCIFDQRCSCRYKRPKKPVSPTARSVQHLNLAKHCVDLASNALPEGAHRARQRLNTLALSIEEAIHNVGVET